LKHRLKFNKNKANKVSNKTCQLYFVLTFLEVCAFLSLFKENISLKVTEWQE
jgi:hypothetical protein